MGGFCGLSPGMQGLCVQSAAPVSVQGELRPRFYQAEGVQARAEGLGIVPPPSTGTICPPEGPASLAPVDSCCAWSPFPSQSLRTPRPAPCPGSCVLHFLPSLQEVTELGIPPLGSQLRPYARGRKCGGRAQSSCVLPLGPPCSMAWSSSLGLSPVPRRSGPCHLGVSGHCTPGCYTPYLS